MKKLLAGVVGMTVLMSNVAFAAVSTTTTYKDGKVEVSTTVTELENDSMVTYVLYGEKDKTTTPFGEDGSVDPTGKSAPDQNNIIYIDQENCVTGGQKTFTAPGLEVGEAYGAKVIVGTDASADEGDVAVDPRYFTGDMYTLKLDDATNYTAKVEVLMGTGYPMIYTLDTTDEKVQVPVSADCQITFTAVSGKEIVTSKVGIATVDGSSINLNTANYTKGNTYDLSATVKNKVELPVVTVSDAIADLATDEDSVTFLVNVSDPAKAMKTGLKVTYINGYTFDNLTPIQADSGRYAIRIVNESDTLTFSSTTNDYIVAAFMEIDDVRYYSDSEDNNHFTFEKNVNLGNDAQDDKSTQESESEVSTVEEESTEDPVVVDETETTIEEEVE